MAKKDKKGKKEKKQKNDAFDQPVNGEGPITAGDSTPKTFEALPTSVQPAQLVKCERKPTRDGNGELMNAQFKIIDGEFKGRTIFNNANLENPNEQTVEIAIEQLKNHVAAAGLESIDSKWDWTPLLNVPVMIHVKFEKGDDQYPDKNSVNGFSPYEQHNGSVDKAAKKKGKKKGNGKKDKGKPGWSKK
jgi:hypothetical protein